MLSQQRRTLQALAEASRAADRRPALFIDKDGTLVENVPFNVDPARLRFAPKALEALAAISAAGYALVVVTNQSGVALGRFTRGQLSRLEKALRERLWTEGGVRLDGFHACVHAPGKDGTPSCLCRKPAPGLLQQAALKHRLDLTRSWMVGDILDDVEAGRRAGARSILLDVGNETEWLPGGVWREPHHRCRSWCEVAELVLGRARLASAPAAWSCQAVAAR